MVAGDPALAMESIAADVRELPADALAGTAARLWLSLPPEARKGTVILAPTHEMREEINAAVRRGLVDEGALGRRSVEIGRLVDRRLTRVHAADGETYRPGDVVVANRDVYGLREGQAWTVAGTGDDGVRLERRSESRTFAPSGNAAHNLSLCESRPLPLRAGDEIVWTRNIRRRGLINGERATVERIAGELRLLGGDLVLKIEYGGAAVQVRLGNAARFPDDGGISIRHGFGLRMPLSVRRLLDFWSVAGRPAPRNGKGRGAGFGRSTGW